MDKLVKNRLRELRVDRGWSQQDLADRVDHSVFSVSRHECGSRDISKDALSLYAQALDVPEWQIYRPPVDETNGEDHE